MTPDERSHFLRTVSTPRFQRLSHIVSAFARTYTDFYPPGTGAELEGWYEK